MKTLQGVKSVHMGEAKISFLSPMKSKGLKNRGNSESKMVEYRIKLNFYLQQN